MPRKAIATAAGLVALLVERTELEDDTTVLAVVGLLVVYLICHTVTDVVAIIRGKGDEQ